MKPAAVQLNRELEENLVDDDELQLALARQRRKVTKKVNRVRPEDIASRGKLALLCLDVMAFVDEILFT